MHYKKPTLEESVVPEVRPREYPKSLDKWANDIQN